MTRFTPPGKMPPPQGAGYGDASQRHAGDLVALLAHVSAADRIVLGRDIPNSGPPSAAFVERALRGGDRAGASPLDEPAALRLLERSSIPIGFGRATGRRFRTA